MKEAVLYEQDGERVRCTACKHFCSIAPPHTGICGIRQNREGKLYLLAYGKASAVNVDPIEKKPLYHVLPGKKIFSLGTVGCNFGCDFCQNWDLSQSSKELKKKILQEKTPELAHVRISSMGYDLPPEKIIDICTAEGIPSIAYTYNEPIIFFEYLYDTARLATGKGMHNVLVSNGYESDEALERLEGHVQAMNIDLKSFRNEFYERLCKAKLQPVLDTIRKAKSLGIWVEVTTLVIPGQNDSDKELQDIAAFIASVDKDMPWHVTAFYPDYRMDHLPPTSKQALDKAFAIGKKAGLRFVYVGNIHDPEKSSTFCPSCNTLLVARDGYHTTIHALKDGICTNCEEKIPGIWR